MLNLKQTLHQCSSTLLVVFYTFAAFKFVITSLYACCNACNTITVDTSHTIFIYWIIYFLLSTLTLLHFSPKLLTTGYFVILKPSARLSESWSGLSVAML